MAKANMAEKAFITSSQLLESMEMRSTPSRAEVSDVSNAVLDGTDYVMLSSKTANGQYHLKALDLLCKCCVEVEKMLAFRVVHNNDQSIEELIAAADHLSESDDESEKQPKWMIETNKLLDNPSYQLTTTAIDWGFRLKFLGQLGAPLFFHH